MPLNGGEEERVLEQPEAWADWALSRTGIYFLTRTKIQTGRIEFFDFVTRKRTLIGEVEKPSLGLALGPDGRSLLYSRNEYEDFSIMLARNFH